MVEENRGNNNRKISKKQYTGEGRPTMILNLEDILYDFIVDIRI